MQDSDNVIDKRSVRMSATIDYNTKVSSDWIKQVAGITIDVYHRPAMMDRQIRVYVYNNRLTIQEFKKQETGFWLDEKIYEYDFSEEKTI